MSQWKIEKELRDSGLDIELYVPLRRGYRLDPMKEEMDTNIGRWIRTNKDNNVEKVRFYQGQHFRGVYWVALKDILPGCEVIGDPTRIKEIVLDQ